MSAAVNFVFKAVNSVIEFSKDINPATLSGAIDVIVVEQPDGTLACSPFHVRFGKLRLLTPKEKVVDIYLNDKITPFKMKVGDAGETFFVTETKKPVPVGYATSPIPQPVKTDVMVEEFSLDSGAPLSASPGNSILGGPLKPSQLLSGITAASPTFSSSPPQMNLSSSLLKPSINPSSANDVLDSTGTSPPTNGLTRTDPTSPTLERGTSLLSQAIAESNGVVDELRVEPVENIDTIKENGILPPSPIKRTGSMSNTIEAEIDVSARGSVSAQPVPPKVVSSWSWGWGSLPERQLASVANTSLASSPPSAMSSTDTLAVGVNLREDAAELALHLSTNVLTDVTLEISACGTQLILEPGKCYAPYEKFANVFTSSRLVNGPDSLVEAMVAGNSASPDSNLVVKLGLRLYPLSIIQPLLLSAVAFRKIPTEETIVNVFQRALKAGSSPSHPSANSKRVPSGGMTYNPLKLLWPRSNPAGTPVEHVETGTSPPSGVLASSPVQDFIPLNYTKSLRLTSAQLKELKLQYGANKVTFEANSRLQGVARCSARIYLWKHDEQVVISDIDGTITKSDALGHLFAVIGRDWTHSGVANLYTNIYKNGYKIMYLTARAIGQADSTRGFLKGVEQGAYQLPDGPVLCSPDRLFAALHREVIIRKPEEFKIACLSDIKRLFGPNREPFYAGFGNRETDVTSYRKVGVSESRIFTINPQGHVRRERLGCYKSSYIGLNELVNEIFPGQQHDPKSVQYNDLLYWKSDFARIPLPPLPSASSNAANHSGTSSASGSMRSAQTPTSLKSATSSTSQPVKDARSAAAIALMASRAIVNKAREIGANSDDENDEDDEDDDAFPFRDAVEDEDEYQDAIGRSENDF